jgi:hypothetical protein
MRKSIFFTAFLFSVLLLKGQANEHKIIEGDILMLGKPTSSTYVYIDFPKSNIIIKRGAIASFNSLINEKVFVSNIKTDKKGNTIADLKRANGLKFFRFYPIIKANITKALKCGELRPTKHKGQNAIAQK